MSLILVVEDDDAIRSNIVRLLSLEGFETASAADGVAGLAQARRRAPELIISDVNMPAWTALNCWLRCAAMRRSQPLLFYC